MKSAAETDALAPSLALSAVWGGNEQAPNFTSVLARPSRYSVTLSY